MHSILRLPAVKSRCGLSRSTIYERIRAGEFPAPINLGGRAVGWPEAEIDAWIARQIEQSRKAAGEAGER
jgi:prophage regulatory protein